VSEKTEPVDGHECWRVEASASGTDGSIVRRCQFWLDPAIGFNPRRIRMDEKWPADDDFTILVDMEDYVEVSKGIWFPRKQTCEHIMNRDGLHISKNIYTVKEIHGDREYKREQLRPIFPPGARIWIDSRERTRSQYYIVNSDGRLEPIDESAVQVP